MRGHIHLALCAMAASLPAALPAQDAEQRVAWNRPFEPFKIADNVHYVGLSGLSAFLITGPEGHVLIDGGLPESAPLIAANIRALGYRLEDVRYILINHAHFDHSGGLAQLRRLTGARLLASGGDRADLETGRVAGRPELGTAPPVPVDRVIADGERLRLTGIDLTAHLTPGHTRGCTSWRLRTAHHSVLFTCSITVAGQNLIDDPTYPNAASDFRRTFARLRGIEADIFLNFHPDFFDLDGRRQRQRAGEETAFTDPSALRRHVDRAEAAFERELARQQAGRAIHPQGASKAAVADGVGFEPTVGF